MLNQHKILILAGGATLSVFALIYIIRKRQKRDSKEEDDCNYPNNVLGEGDTLDHADLNAAADVASASQSSVEVPVPAYIVGTIIGRSGSNIKQLRRQFGVRFDFEKEVNKDDANLPKSQQKDRILTISGERDKVYEAEIHVCKMISEQPKFVDESMIIPQESVGRVIGKGGKTIRELQSVSGAKILVDRIQQSSDSTERCVQLSGTTVQVEYAKLLIKEKVDEEIHWQQKRKEEPIQDRVCTSSSDIIDEKESLVVDENIHLPKLQEETLWSSEKIVADSTSGLQTGSFIPVFISAFDTPDHVWIQLVTKESSYLDTLINELTNVYSQCNMPPLEKGSVGDICIAPFPHDDLLYRARIEEINIVERTAQLYYIDFGDSGSMPLDKLKLPKSEHLQLPPQAIECYLNIAQPSHGWSDESIEHFDLISGCAQWIQMMATIIDTNKSECPVIQIINTNVDPEVDLALDMITKGYAVSNQKIEN